MNDYIKLIIFNVIMIFLSFSFKKYIIIFYVFECEVNSKRDNYLAKLRDALTEIILI